jgi:threonine dehydratase
MGTATSRAIPEDFCLSPLPIRTRSRNSREILRASRSGRTPSSIIMPSLSTRKEIESLAPHIVRVIPSTSQFTWPLLNARTGCELWVKHENHTNVGSFKIRGALAYMMRLREREPHCRGVIAATRGNHGQAVAFAATRSGLSATIVVPLGNSTEKNRAMRALGADLIEHGGDFQAALEHSKHVATSRGFHPVPSFHHDLVTGNAVSAVNFLQSVPVLDAVYVPIGLGSGICAMMAARDALALPTRIIGVAAEGAPGIALSFEARHLIPHAVSTRIADGLACSTPHPEALQHILRGVERIVLVSDDEVESAMHAYFSDTHNVAEGAAAAGLAAVLRDREFVTAKRVGLVFTGGNVDASVFARVLVAGR